MKKPASKGGSVMHSNGANGYWQAGRYSGSLKGVLIPVNPLGMGLLQTPSSHQGFNSIAALGATLLTVSLGHCVSAFHAAANV